MSYILGTSDNESYTEPFLGHLVPPSPPPPSWVMQIQTIRSTDCRMNGNFANWQLCFLHLDFLTFFVTLAHSDLIWVSQASNEWRVSGRKSGELGRVLPARDVDAGKIRQNFAHPPLLNKMISCSDKDMNADMNRYEYEDMNIFSTIINKMILARSSRNGI